MTKAFLIIAVSVGSCSLDNINTAEVYRIEMQEMEECQAVAESLDPRSSIRAFCEEK